MDESYKDLIPYIDIARNPDSVEIFEFKGFRDLQILGFMEDIENNNDPIELQLIKNKAYKEATILGIKKTENSYLWKDFLKEEQKTFGGSKIFYMNNECTKIMILALPNEMQNKVKMVISRINKINGKISRINSRIKKDNIDVYAYKLKSKAAINQKDNLINLINQNLKV